ncbi:MAG: hypothetical protein GY833_11395 [Aestuariibacter sp.]|nr:hypothetical protein [Aestuariibacter sp.]
MLHAHCKIPPHPLQRKVTPRRNSILWGDNSGSKESGYEIFTNNGNFTFEHSVVPNNGNALTKSGVAGSFNIDATNIYTDPLFSGGTPYDYHLKSISPAIDRGTVTGAPGDDIDGDARPQGTGVDVGSDEF